MVQWLGFVTFTHAARVRFPVGEMSLGQTLNDTTLFVTMVEWSNTIDLRSISLWRAQVRTLLVTHLALLAQSVEHQTFNLRVAGSSPARGYFSPIV